MLAGVLLAWFALGCGASDSASGQRTPDSATAATNALGQVCGASTDCPASPSHTCVFLAVGSQTQGYCSPMCTAASDCTAGYTGPATGQLECFVPNTENACSIACTGPADCPAGLDCVATGGPMSFCAVPQ